MTERIKSAFDSIRAEDSLKESTLLRLREKIESQAQPRRYPKLRQAVLSACLLLLVVLGGFSYSAYFTEAAYVDLDINPSLELTLNRFERVIGARAYNADGENLLSGLNLRNQKVGAALNALIAATQEAGLLRDDGLVSVTLQSSLGNAAQLLVGIRSELQTAVSHHSAAQVEVYPVEAEIHSMAQELQMTPAKYLAIIELQQLDPTVSLDACKDHSLGEIKRWTEGHDGHHHEGAGDGAANDDATTPVMHESDPMVHERDPGSAGDDGNHDNTASPGHHDGATNGGQPTPSLPESNPGGAEQGNTGSGGNHDNTATPGHHNGAANGGQTTPVPPESDPEDGEPIPVLPESDPEDGETIPVLPEDDPGGAENDGNGTGGGQENTPTPGHHGSEHGGQHE